VRTSGETIKKHVGNLRWGIAILLAFGIVINYFDRTNISVATKPLEHDFGLSAGQMGIILSSYLWSYALLQIPVGALLDKVGIKWLMRVGSILWTLATLMTALVGGLGLIILSRIILGIAEAPAFPGASKATGYWFPLNERGLATSSFDAAAKFSNVIGVPIVAGAVTAWGWRGYNSTRVRKTLLTIGMLLGIAVIGAAFTTSANIAIIWISIALGGLAFSAPIGWSIPALIAPKGTVGTVGSIMNFFNNLAGIASPIIAGFIFQATGSFAVNFLIAGGILILGILSYLFLLGPIDQIQSPDSETIQKAA
jgi:MFS family permease